MKYLLHLFLVCCAASSVAQSNPDSWVYWGEDNTFSTGSNHLLIGNLLGTPAIGNIDNNFWGSGIDPDPTTPACTTSPNIPANGFWHNNSSFCGELNCSVGFTATISGLSTETAWSGSISCSGGFNIKPKGGDILTLSHPLVLDSCMRLFGWSSYQPQNSQEYKEQYDSLRAYIQSCAAKDNSSWQVFSTMNGAVQAYSNDTSRFDTYRDWLISVLYLNKTNPEYFCAVVGAIASTFQYGKYTPLGYLAVMNYLRQFHSPTCWGSVDESNYVKDSAYDSQHGHDASHLPPLDSLGLGFLLKATVTSQTPLPSSHYLASFTSSPNPFIGEASLEFTLNRMSYVTLAIYDELGRLVWGDGKGSSLEAGMHSIQIDGSKLPSGTLYARISTGFGEVKTVKLVHEK